MRRILAYEQGRPVWSENDPGAYARPQGHGGEALGSSFVVTAVKQNQHRNATPRNSDRAICPKSTRWGDPCARALDHRDPCASRNAMDHENRRRRV